MAKMIIGGKVVNEELTKQLDELSVAFVALIGAIANDIYGDDVELSEDQWTEFQQDFFVGFIDFVMCTFDEEA